MFGSSDTFTKLNEDPQLGVFFVLHGVRIFLTKEGTETYNNDIHRWIDVLFACLVR